MKEWIDYVQSDARAIGIASAWIAAALERGVVG